MFECLNCRLQIADCRCILVPKLRLGALPGETPFRVPGCTARETEFRKCGSQTEFGIQGENHSPTPADPFQHEKSSGKKRRHHARLLLIFIGTSFPARLLTLIKFTEGGVKGIKETCKRAADFKAHAKKHGIEVKEQLWCMGAYHGVIVFQDPDDETATDAMLSLSSRDNVSTQTMRAFDAGEMSKVVGKIA